MAEDGKRLELDVHGKDKVPLVGAEVADDSWINRNKRNHRPYLTGLEVHPKAIATAHGTTHSHTARHDCSVFSCKGLEQHSGSTFHY